MGLAHPPTQALWGWGLVHTTDLPWGPWASCLKALWGL